METFPSQDSPSPRPSKQLSPLGDKQMTSLKTTLVAATLMLSLSTVSFAGTITGSRTNSVGTITGSAAGTITGSRTGTITGSAAGTITGSRTNEALNIIDDGLIAKVTMLVLSIGW